jgi:neutral amino acid transport system permease protein
MDFVSIINAALTEAFGPTLLVYALAAIGLNVHFGYGGMLNFGQAAFVAVGAYGMAMMVVTFSPMWFPDLAAQATFWLGIGLGLVGAVVLALLLGVPTLRLRADYLAIATISAAEIIRRVLRSSTLRQWTGGSDGRSGFADVFREYGYGYGDMLSRAGDALGLAGLGRPLQRGERFDLGPFFYTSTQLWVMVVGWILVGLTILVVWLAMRSPWGRVLKAIREDEDAVRSLGKNVFSYKLQALVLGGVIGALAGFISGLTTGTVIPDTYGPQFTFFLYAMVILGGAARVFGPLVGAMIFWFMFQFLTQALRQMSVTGIFPPGLLDPTQVGPIVFVMLGVGIIVLLIFRPQGIFGDRREISLDVR